MADVKALKSYLVSLGFDANMSQYLKFETTLKDAANLVKSKTFGIATDVLKWQTAITGMFLTVSGAVLGTVDKVAMADQEFRLFGQRMFLNTAQARTLKVAMDALGEPLEAIAFDPELHQRFNQLRRDQALMTQQLGPDFEQNMRRIRDMRFEFTRFQVEVQYFTMSVVQELFKALGLGSGNILATLRRLNEYFIAHIPEWSRFIAVNLVPILKDTWGLLKDIGMLIEHAAAAFTQLVGIISGDSSLEGTTFDFHKFAGAIQHVVQWLDKLVKVLLWVEDHFLGTIAGAGTGSGIGGFLGSIIGGIAGIEGGPLGIAAGAATGGATGTAIGGAVGGGAGLLFDLFRQRGRAAGSNAGGDLASMVRAVMSVESGGKQTDRFGNTLRSSAGALGLMQLMPSTARGLGIDPNNAYDNLRGGTAYLKQLFAKYGNWNDALAAYNWGPGNVDRALIAHRAFPQAVDNYVSSVMARYSSGSGGVSNSNSVSVQVHVNQPGASAEHIGRQVAQQVGEVIADNNRRALIQLQPSF